MLNVVTIVTYKVTACQAPSGGLCQGNIHVAMQAQEEDVSALKFIHYAAEAVL
jgi:hypothetical protein